MKTHRLYKDVSKRALNGITARIRRTIMKYSYQEFKLVATRYINDDTKERLLNKEIAKAEKALQELKNK